MAFSQTVEDFCKHLDTAPVQKVSEDRLKGKSLLKDISFQVPGEKEKRVIEMPKVLDRPMPSSGDVKKHMMECQEHRKKGLEKLKGVGAKDQRKLAAIAKAGISGGSVKDHFKVLSKLPAGMCGSTPTLASAAQMQKGLEKVKAEGLKLDSDW